ncbi:heme ABC exporter ATP-binding protein CcmA [Pelagibacteraceae bacterium]|nr:heme ABC exporter ATP-binding protein CcmA [Pelagibacteraceae bacterium]
MILVKDLSIERSNKKIFENVNLSLGSGKIILLKGKNGSGKTTLLKALLNLIEPSSGAIYWKGKLLKKNLYNFFNHVTYIADRTSSLSKLSVQENIKIWKKIFLSNINNSQVENILKTLKLDIYLDQKVNSLSFGERKKLEFLRLVIENKKIWILDEPLSNLDNESIDVIAQTIEDHRSKDGSIIFSSHQESEINVSEEVLL